MSTLSSAITASASALVRRAHAHRGRGLEPGQRRVHAIGRTASRIAAATSCCAPSRSTASSAALGRSTATGVKVAAVVEDQSEFRRRYEPSHPDADEDGFVSLPNVDAPQEMVDMLGAARAYQANLAAIGIIRDMVAKALELGKG